MLVEDNDDMDVKILQLFNLEELEGDLDKLMGDISTRGESTNDSS